VPAIVTPALNETTSPYQFDGTVVMGGANASAALTPMTPATVNLKAWNFPTWLATGTASAVTLIGSVYLSAVHLNYGQTYSNIYVRIQANTGTASVGSNWAGLYNSAGTLVATTADISGILGTAAGTTGYLAFPLATAYTPSTGGLYWTACQFSTGAVATSSMPVFYAMANQVTLTTSAGVIGGPLLTAGTNAFPFAAVATTSATALPATFALGSAGTTGAYVYWAGLA
jgi:hypothetical protein